MFLSKLAIPLVSKNIISESIIEKKVKRGCSGVTITKFELKGNFPSVRKYSETGFGLLGRSGAQIRSQNIYVHSGSCFAMQRA
jgi:hypothetical protein